MKIVIAGFGYGANLSPVFCWDSKTFWRRPWESRPRQFFSDTSNVILSNWKLFSRVWLIYQEWDLIPTCSTVLFPCASVRTAPLRSRSLNASAVCAMIAEGSDSNSLMLLCKHGVRPRRAWWFFRKRVLYSLISRTKFTANFSISLTPSDETMDDCVVGARRGCLTILECGACTEYAVSRFCCEARIFSGCTGRGERYARHYMMFTTTTAELGNPLLASDNVVSLSHCLTLAQPYLPRAYEESRGKKNIRTFHSRWEMKVYFILYVSIKYLILCVWI